MEDNDDDYFSDDFDSLPPGTLYELEQNAFQATQAPVTQRHVQPSLNDGAQAGPLRQASATVKPPPRLHTGLTNDYDTLEVGELEAEVHDNLEGTVALTHGHHVPVANNGWPAQGAMDDAMDVDNDHGQADIYEMKARLQQVGVSHLAR